MIEAILSIYIIIGFEVRTVTIFARDFTSGVPHGVQYDQPEIWRYLDYSKLEEYILSSLPYLPREFHLQYDGYLPHFKNCSPTSCLPFRILNAFYAQILPLVVTKDNAATILEHAMKSCMPKEVRLTLHLKGSDESQYPRPSCIKISTQSPCIYRGQQQCTSEPSGQEARPRHRTNKKGATIHELLKAAQEDGDANSETTEHAGLSNVEPRAAASEADAKQACPQQ